MSADPAQSCTCPTSDPSDDLAPTRKYPRSRVDFPIQYTSEGSTGHTRVLTLGGGGLFLGISQQISPGSELTVRMRPAKHLPIVRARGRVLYWLPNQGIGIEFIEINPRDRQLMLRLIRRRMPGKGGFPRVPLAVQVGHEGGTFIGISKDISAGGMFIETKKRVCECSKLSLRFNLDDGGPTLITTAEVCYVVEKLGIGVQFADLLPAYRGRLASRLAKDNAACEVETPVNSTKAARFL